MSYLPRGDNAIIDRGQQFLIVISDPLNYDRWGIRKPSEELNELYGDFSMKLAACKQNNHRPVDVVAKNVARAKLQKAYG